MGHCGYYCGYSKAAFAVAIRGRFDDDDDDDDTGGDVRTLGLDLSSSE
jgi:hypothetical protein